jgi:hypothetical protein
LLTREAGVHSLRRELFRRVACIETGEGGHVSPGCQDHPSTGYLVLTMKLTEEAADVPVIEVIRAVRTAAVALAASRGEEPRLADVEQVARRHLGLAG